MARQYRVRRAQLRMHTRGTLPRFNEDRALKRAQKKSAKSLLKRVKTKAASAMKPASQRHEPITRRGTGMIQGYRVGTPKDGSITLYNRRFSALLFEEGAQPHFIFARKGKTLKFNYGAGTPFHYPPAVAHPGQPARPVMAKSMEEHVGEIEKNLAESIEQEWNTVGAR